MQIVLMVTAYILMFKDQIRPRLACDSLRSRFADHRKDRRRSYRRRNRLRHLGALAPRRKLERHCHFERRPRTHQLRPLPLYPSSDLYRNAAGFCRHRARIGRVPRADLAFVLCMFAFYSKAKKEELFLSQEFGEKFREHSRRTGMFLPRLT